MTDEDTQWIRRHYEVFNRLAAESASFRFALEAGTDWRFSNQPQSAIARVWSGIEAIFGVSSELVYRISLVAASLLEPRGDARRIRFDTVKRLYGLRSKVIHGAVVSQEKLAEALDHSYRLLRDLLVLTIEKGYVLGDDDFNEAVFG